MITTAIRRTLTCGALALSFSYAAAQAPAAPPTAFDRQLARIDFALSGKGEFTTQTNGTNYLNQSVNLDPSNTLGALATLRYIKSPLIGIEFNYGYARYTDNYTNTNTATSPAAATGFVLGVQTSASEYTFGYVAHLRRTFYNGITPFASIGAGSTAFRPTKGGGQGNLPQARATYYYSVGADGAISPHFGLRATFRQSIENAPDYQQNYWRIYKHQIATEPAFGVYVRF